MLMDSIILNICIKLRQNAHMTYICIFFYLSVKNIAMSRIDLYNCLLFGIAKSQIYKLQKVLNCAAKLILGKKKV